MRRPMNEINRLMDKFAKDYDDADVEEIIAFVRKQLAMYDAGIKPKRSEVEQLDMTQIVANIQRAKGKIPAQPTAKPKMRRRI
jgi:hypothetical protein